MAEPPEIPPLDPSAQEYLDLLFELGPVASGGFGATGISWQEIGSWMTVTRQTLRPLEAQMIRRLSQLYASVQQEYRASDAPSPFVADTSATEQTASVETSIGSVFGALSKRAKR